MVSIDCPSPQCIQTATPDGLQFSGHPDCRKSGRAYFRSFKLASHLLHFRFDWKIAGYVWSRWGRERQLLVQAPSEAWLCSFSTRGRAIQSKTSEAVILLSAPILEICADGIDRLGGEESLDRIKEIAASYTAMVEHGSGCDQCNEVEEVGRQESI
jgi:hypothetical protein